MFSYISHFRVFNTWDWVVMGYNIASTKLILLVEKMVTSKFLLVEKKVKFDSCYNGQTANILS